jgi:hypothetical protein
MFILYPNGPLYGMRRVRPTCHVQGAWPWDKSLVAVRALILASGKVWFQKYIIPDHRSVSASSIANVGSAHPPLFRISAHCAGCVDGKKLALARVCQESRLTAVAFSPVLYHILLCQENMSTAHSIRCCWRAPHGETSHSKLSVSARGHHGRDRNGVKCDKLHKRQDLEYAVDSHCAVL